MAYKQTKNLYKTVKDGMVFENKLCGFVSSNFCSTDEVSLGEIFPEGFDSGFEANITESNKSEYVEHKDKSLVEMTIKTYFPPYAALRIMYKGRLDVWEYDGNPTTWTDVLLPERRSTDPGCLTNVFLLPHPFCEVPSLVINHQVGKGNVQALSQ